MIDLALASELIVQVSFSAESLLYFQMIIASQSGCCHSISQLYNGFVQFITKYIVNFDKPSGLTHVLV